MGRCVAIFCLLFAGCSKAHSYADLNAAVDAEQAELDRLEFEYAKASEELAARISDQKEVAAVVALSARSDSERAKADHSQRALDSLLERAKQHRLEWEQKIAAQRQRVEKIKGERDAYLD